MLVLKGLEIDFREPLKGLFFYALQRREKWQVKVFPIITDFSVGSRYTEVLVTRPRSPGLKFKETLVTMPSVPPEK